MSKYILIILVLIISRNDLLFAQVEQTTEAWLNYPQEIIEFSNRIEMIPISGDDFVRPDYYGGVGTPYLLNVITRSFDNTPRPSSFVFWGVKNDKKYLVLAVDNKTDPYKVIFEIESMISISDIVGHDYDIPASYGMVTYDGIFGFNKDLSEFKSIQNPDKKGPKGIYPSTKNGFKPIIIYDESSTMVLYYYKKEWYLYEEGDY